jgi:hypothetical protein
LVILCEIILSPLLSLDAHAIGCVGNCLLTADTNVPTSDATVLALVDNANYTVLPHTFSFVTGTIHTIQILTLTLQGTSTGAQYIWKQWSLNNTGNQYTASTTLTTPTMVLNYTAGQGGKFIAEYRTQFKLTLSFTDPSGQFVTPPASVTLTSGAMTVTDSSYTGQWLDAQVWNVVNATWQGDPNTESAKASFDLSAGPVTGVLKLKAYSATIDVVDKSARPLANAIVTVTFANQTTKSFNTDNQGQVHLDHIPLGPYSVQVNYQGQNMGSWSADASTDPTLTTVLNVGGSQPQAPQNLLSTIETYWYLIAAGFIAGFAGMGGAARLSGKKTRPAREPSETDVSTSETSPTL